MLTKSFWVATFIMGMASAGFAVPTPFERECERLASQNLSDAKRLQGLLTAQWKQLMEDSPEFATFVGYPGQNRRWSDNSLEAIERRKRENAAPLAVLKKIRPAKLSASDRLNYDLFKRDVELSLVGNKFPGELLAMSQLSGIQIDPAQVIAVMPQTKASHYDDILARLRSLPAVIDQTIVLLKEGVKRKVVPPKITLRDVPEQIRAQMVTPSKSPLLNPFQKMAPGIPPDVGDRLKKEAEKIYLEAITPAYKRLADYFVNEYLPATRETIAWTSLPNGEAWYEYQVKRSTTTQHSPKEIHEIGLSEVKRIRAQMEAVMRETKWDDDFASFLKFLRTDSRFFYKTGEELLRGYRDIAKQVDPALTRLFTKLPRTPYGVLPVPSYSERSQPTAYYEPGSVDGGRPGYFFANTYNLKMRPKWEMEALTLHEAVPGHHLQIALAMEMPETPEFRKHGGYTAYVEGWGLYAESLGGELGMYKDPYSKFGQLTYEMWRAVRLVTDTGMHSLGWSRDRAIEFFKQNTSKTEHDITVEVDRYIVWAGQALAYKMGELKIKELRKEAEKALGESFDVRSFHDAVLANGAVPLDILETGIRAWIQQSKGAASASPPRKRGAK